MTPTSRTDVLDRAFPAPSDAFDRLVQLRDRRTRTRRIAAGAVTMLAVAIVVAAILGGWRLPFSRMPASGPITPSNVGELGLDWWGPTTANIYSQPIVADDRVYVLSGNGTISAFPTDCGSSRCDPIWSATAGWGSSRAWGSAAVAGDRVYQPSSDGRLVGYPTTCAADPCRPDWIGAAAGDLTTASPVVGDGFVFVGSDECCHGSRSYGHLFAFSAACETFPTPCRPVWKATLAHGFFGGQPVIVDGRVYVGSSDGTVYAFPTTCAAVRGRCEAVWTAKTHGRIAAKVGFGIVTQIVTPLVTSGSSLYVASGSSLYAFPLSCDASPCIPTWISHTGGWINDIAAGDRFVYASAEPHLRDGGRGFAGGTLAFPTQCSHRCSAAWDFGTIQSSPTISGGVVYLVGSGNAGDSAFDEACPGADAGCTPLWSMSADNGGTVNFGSVTDGALYVGGLDGNLHAFRRGGAATCCEAGVPTEGRWVAYLVYATAIGGLGLLVLRRRRATSGPG